MESTIGRIVIYHCDEEQQKQNNFMKDAPAMITSVWNETCVNLKVNLDGEGTLWMTSVTEGTGERNWSWPEIVK
jgi:hypothetical protein